LSPRQALTAAPSALNAVNGAGWQQSAGAVTNTNNSFVGINRNARLTSNEYFGILAPVTNTWGGMYIQTVGQTARPFYGYVAGRGSNSAWTEFDGATGNWNVYNQGTRLTVTNSGDVGIGTQTPSAQLDVETPDYIAVQGTSANANGTGVQGTGSI